MKIKLTEGYIIKTDSRQFVCGKEKIDKDGKSILSHVRYSSKIEHALKSFCEGRIRACDAQSFEELAEEIKKLTETIKSISKRLEE